MRKLSSGNVDKISNSASIFIHLKVLSVPIREHRKGK